MHEKMHQELINDLIRKCVSRELPRLILTCPLQQMDLAEK